MKEMEKGKKLIISSVVIGGLAGGTFLSSQVFSVSAAEIEEESNGWNWEDQNEVMQGHMTKMHGRTNRMRENRDELIDSEDFDGDISDEEREIWEDRHNRMWESRNDEQGELDEGQLEDSDGFFGNMRNHMRGFGDGSFDDMFEWMEDMHGSFNGRRGMMNWNQDDQSEDSNGESENAGGRGFMNRFNFFKSN